MRPPAVTKFGPGASRVVSVIVPVAVYGAGSAMVRGSMIIAV